MGYKGVILNHPQILDVELNLFQGQSLPYLGRINHVGSIQK